MTVQERITRELCERNLWRGGMRYVKGDEATRCIDDDEANCDTASDMVDCLEWDSDSDTYWWVSIPDDSWLIALDDTATHGVLWDVLCEACDSAASVHYSPAMDREFVVVMKTQKCGGDCCDDDMLTFPIAENGLGFALASAILAVWGVEVR